METAIVNPPEVFPNLPYTGKELTNFIYYSTADAFCLCLDNWRGHEIFKPADSYQFRIWLTYYKVPEHPARKTDYYRNTIKMKQDHLQHKPSQKEGQIKTPSTFTKVFQYAALAFGIAVACIYIAFMVYIFGTTKH